MVAGVQLGLRTVFIGNDAVVWHERHGKQKQLLLSLSVVGVGSQGVILGYARGGMLDLMCFVCNSWDSSLTVACCLEALVSVFFPHTKLVSVFFPHTNLPCLVAPCVDA